MDLRRVRPLLLLLLLRRLLRLWVFSGLLRVGLTDMLPSPSYLLLAPREVHQGVPFKLSVSILASHVRVLVNCRLQGSGYNASSSRTFIQGGSTALMELPLTAPLPDRSILLAVQGHLGDGRLLFSSERELAVRSPAVASLVQTDRPRYRPGDAVRVRVVSFGAQRRPRGGPVDVVVKDPRGNVVRQWLALNSTRGVVSRELQLSDHPPLGRWTVHTTVHDVERENHFTVAHYVLPKFQVRLSVPSVVYHTDFLFGSASAQHSYGNPVAGRMVVTYVHDGEVLTSDRAVMDDGGAARFELDLSEYPALGRAHRGHGALTVLVNVTEALTGLMQSSEATVLVERSRYKLSFEGSPSVLRPSLNFTATLSISTYDGRPLTLEDQARTVLVTASQRRVYAWDGPFGAAAAADVVVVGNLSGAPPETEEDRREQMSFAVPADGRVPLLVEVHEETGSLVIHATLEDTYKTLSVVSRYRSPSRSYLQILNPSAPAQVGTPLLLTVESNFETPHLFYVVRSRDRVLESGTFSGPLALTPEASWAPAVCLVVYCARGDGEVVNGVLRLPVPLELQNQVSLSWSEERRRPGEEVSLRLSVSEPRSLVGVLVVDAATQQHNSTNDITTASVLKELYGGVSEQYRPDEWSIGDPSSLFESCGLIVLTDATVNAIQEHEIPSMEDIMKEKEEEEEEHAEPRERGHFPDTWLWMDVYTGEANTSERTVTVPDTDRITTWQATAFVMSERLGLGILDTPARLTVFKDFFITLNLPACIIRGEELVLELNLYNYLAMDLQVTVTVAYSASFEFVFPDVPGLQAASVRAVLAKRNGGTNVKIPIRPLALGQMPISVKASSSQASDAIRRNVLVKAEGLEQTYASALFVEPSLGNSSFTGELEFDLPPDVVAGSERAEVTVVGDLLGPSIEGLDSLIQMPYGCGEQNMINFAPNVYVLQYLDRSGQSAPETVARATVFMQKGYERELSYQREDGSFSAFGESDSSGSTWLSAFVLRCFLPARRFMPIDPRVLARTASWLSGQLGPDGGYLEPGRVIHTELQGGLDGPASLTAYVLMALLQDDEVRSQYSAQVSEALMYLETRLALGISSDYGLCLVTYALALSGSASAGGAWDTLVGRAQIRDGVPFWGASEPGLTRSWQPPTAHIEMAAYALLSLHLLGRLEEGIPIMKWLTQQRNHLGGYGSTQDTVVALQALSVFAFASAEGTNLSILVESGGVPVGTFVLDANNHMVQQSRQVRPSHLDPTVQQSRQVRPSHLDSTVKQSRQVRPSHLDANNHMVQQSRQVRPSHLDPTVQQSRQVRPSHLDSTVKQSRQVKPSHLDPTVQQSRQSRQVRPSHLDANNHTVQQSRQVRPSHLDANNPAVQQSRQVRPSHLDPTVQQSRQRPTGKAFHLDPTVKQSRQIDAAGEIKLHVAAVGQGVALVQLNVFYNINNTEVERRRRDAGDEEAFHLDVHFSDGQTLFGARIPPRLSVCFR
ncbi:unnamed protein product [Boreogadus saida]